MSTHQVNIVEIQNLNKHPNADKLSITNIDGWQCIVGLNAFKVGDKAVYVQPDYVINLTRPEFAFLAKPGSNKITQRITVKRFRGEISQGLLIPVPAEYSHLPIGTNLINELDIVRYEPPEDITTGGNNVKAPDLNFAAKFDVENLNNFLGVIEEGEEIIATEKLHGSNMRATFSKNPDTGEFQQYVGSRNLWKEDSESDMWWKAYRNTPSIGEWCKANPEKILYGEVIGQQSLRYGVTTPAFAAFAILDHGKWIDYDEMVNSLSPNGVPVVPLVYRGPFDISLLRKLAEENSSYITADKGHIREGLCIVPVKERISPKIGRVCLKLVSNRYLET